MKIDFNLIKKVFKLLREYNISELDIQEGEERIRIKREQLSVTTQKEEVSSEIQDKRIPDSKLQKIEAEPKKEDNMYYVTSPFVGTFYRAPSPTSPPYVNVGDIVSPGETLCIIEAMKLMNKIESEVSGKIVEIYIENGESVEYGERLFGIQLSK
jgi:acetyl-CoA carboxylase biotin carboxyl carrier protein